MRTDLALESKTIAKEIKGVREEKETRDGITISRIDVLEQRAADLLDKPVGR